VGDNGKKKIKKKESETQIIEENKTPHTQKKEIKFFFLVEWEL